MFHMLSCFDLKAGVTIEEFQNSNEYFVSHMQKKELVQTVGPVGRRNRHPIMDTDKTGSQEYFYIMSFLDEDQCNRAVDCILSHQEPEDTIHRAVTTKIENHKFICWEDV